MAVRVTIEYKMLFIYMARTLVRVPCAYMYLLWNIKYFINCFKPNQNLYVMVGLLFLSEWIPSYGWTPFHVVDPFLWLDFFSCPSRSLPNRFLSWLDFFPVRVVPNRFFLITSNKLTWTPLIILDR